MGSLFAQRFPRRQKLLLQIQDAAAGPQAYAQLMCLKGLGEIVVGASLHAFHQILGIGAGGEQQNVDVGFAGGRAHAPADIDAV